MTKRPVDFSILENGIFVFKFHKTDRDAIHHLEKIISATGGHFPEPLRTLWDFSQSPSPVPYFLKYGEKVFQQFTFPADTRTAYLVRSYADNAWIYIIRRYANRDIGDEARVFLKREEATAWLLHQTDQVADRQ